MKRKLFSTLAVTALIIASVSCKGDKKNETEAATAQEVAAVTAEATKFMVDKEASQIEWTGFKPTGQHSGVLHLDSGVVKVDGDKITGTFLIDMNSLTVTDLKSGEGKESLEGHLKGMAEGKEDHFFNVAKFPTAAFEVTGVTENAGKKMMKGNLTIRGIKKNIEFPITYAVNGDMMELTSEVFTIDRTEWGVNYGSKSIFDDLGDKFINDDMEIKISLKAKKA